MISRGSSLSHAGPSGAVGVKRRTSSCGGSRGTCTNKCEKAQCSEMGKKMRTATDGTQGNKKVWAKPNQIRVRRRALKYNVAGRNLLPVALYK